MSGNEPHPHQSLITLFFVVVAPSSRSLDVLRSLLSAMSSASTLLSAMSSASARRRLTAHTCWSSMNTAKRGLRRFVYRRLLPRIIYRHQKRERSVRTYSRKAVEIGKFDTRGVNNLSSVISPSDGRWTDDWTSSFDSNIDYTPPLCR